MAKLFDPPKDCFASDVERIYTLDEICTIVCPSEPPVVKVCPPMDFLPPVPFVPTYCESELDGTASGRTLLGDTSGVGFAVAETEEIIHTVQ